MASCPSNARALPRCTRGSLWGCPDCRCRSGAWSTCRPGRARTGAGPRSWRRGAAGDVELAIAVDVQHVQANVIGLRRTFEDGVQLPRRAESLAAGVLEPDHAVLVDDDDVGALVAVEVDELHRVPDLQRFIDLLVSEGRKGGAGLGAREAWRDSRNKRQQEESDAHDDLLGPREGDRKSVV